ncbi:MAG: hypothetical protein U0K36_08760 [Bacteroidales bacterium]|nr:hypothetical protein [Bacteroidales bacterium]
MSKQRALSIKAIVTSRSTDSDGNVVAENSKTYYCSIEEYVQYLISDAIGTVEIGFGPDHPSTLEEVEYVSFIDFTDKTNEKGNTPANVVSQMRAALRNPKEIGAWLWLREYEHTETWILDATIFPMRWLGPSEASSADGSSEDWANGWATLDDDPQAAFRSAWVRHLICELTDSEYSALVSAWVASVEAYIKEQHADTDYTLSFSNPHTIEA